MKMEPLASVLRYPVGNRSLIKMTGKRLSTVQAVAVYCLLTAILAGVPIALHIHGSTAAPATPSTSNSTPYGYPPYQQDTYANLCQAAIDHADNITTYCTSINKEHELRECVDKNLKECSLLKGSTASRVMSPDDEEGYDSYDTDCTKIRQIQEKCPGMYAVTPEEARRNMKDSRTLRGELNKERSEARKDDRERTKDSQKAANELDDKELENDKQHRAEMKALTDRILQLNSDKAKQQLEAFKAAQVQYDNIDKEYMKVRLELRRKVSRAHETKMALGIECRASANTSANQAETELDLRIAEEQKMVRNYRFTNAAGQMRRLLKQKRKRIINRYNLILSKCLAGTEEPGRKIKQEIIKIDNDVADSEQDAREVGARLENLRRMTSENMSALLKSLEDDVASQMTRIQGDMGNLNTDYQNNVNRMRKRRAEAQDNQIRDAIMAGQNQMDLNGRLNEMMADQASSSAEYRCFQKMSQEQIDESRTERANALRGYNNLKRNCKADKDTYVIGACDASRVANDVTEVCKAIMTSNDGSGDTPSSRRSVIKPPGPAPK
jgi:hypothetical protein